MRLRSPFIYTRVLVLTAAAMSTACYKSHMVVDGEVYDCACEFETAVLCVRDFDECDALDPETVPRSVSGSPCVTFEGDPAYVCDAFCASEQSDFDIRYRVTSSRHDGPGQCTREDNTPYLFPRVPNDAVHNGWIVSDLSRMRVSVDGIGDSDWFRLRDKTSVSIQGGVRDGLAMGDSEVFTINRAVVEAEGDVTIGGATVTGLRLSLAAQRAAARWAGAGTGGAWDRWEPVISPDDGLDDEMVFNLRFVAADAGNTLDVRGDTFRVRVDPPDLSPFAVDNDPRSFAETLVAGPYYPTDGADVRGRDGYNLHNPAVDRFLRIMFSARDTITIADDDFGPREVRIDAIWYVQFFSGSPRPRLRVAGGTVSPLVAGIPLSSSESTRTVILDASETVDITGADFTHAFFFVRRTAPGGEQEMEAISQGVVGVVREELAHALGDWDEVCVRTYDGDGLYADACLPSSALKPSKPSAPPLTCSDALATVLPARRFARLLAAAGLESVIDDAYHGKGVTIIAPADYKLPQSEVEYLLQPGNEAALEQFVLQHVWTATSVPASRIADYHAALAGPVSIPNLPCRDGLIHVVGARLD